MAKKQTQDTALRDLKAALKEKKPEHLYIFHGEEAFLRHYYLNQLQKLLIQGPAADFNFHRLNEETMSLDAFQNAVEAIPMMAEFSMVQVDDVDLFSMPEASRNQMIAILGDLPEYCHVVFHYETVPYKPDRRLKKLTAVLEEKGCVVEFKKQQETDLISWIARHFKARGKTIAPQLCRHLILLTGGTMTALQGEIEKISAYARQEEITRSDIDAVVEPVLEAHVFHMTDAMAGGNYEKAMQTLQTLLRIQEEPIKLLAAIGAQFRKIHAAKLLLADKQNAQALKKLYAMGDYPAQKTMEFARRFPARACASAVRLCAETDYQIKTSYDDAARLLELLLIRIAQEVRLG